MARVRLLIALFLVAVGTTFGALAISGYYEPHMTHGQRVTGETIAPQAAEEPRPILFKPRHQFVAADDNPAPAKPKAKPTPAKAKPPVQAVKDKKPSRAAAQWPWDPFRN